MLKKIGSLLLHLAMLAVVCVIAAYWAVRIMTPLPSASPPPQAVAAPREADPALAARMFGLVQAASVQRALNVQVLGVFAAGRASSAIVAVDGKPPRVVLLNQNLSTGAKLVGVRRDAVTIEQAGVRQEIAAPARQELRLGGAPPPPGFTREGNVLSAPTVAPPSAPPGLPQMPTRGMLPQQMPPAQQQVYPQQPSPETMLRQALPGQSQSH